MGVVVRKESMSFAACGWVEERQRVYDGFRGGLVCLQIFIQAQEEQSVTIKGTFFLVARDCEDMDGLLE